MKVSKEFPGTWEELIQNQHGYGDFIKIRHTDDEEKAEKLILSMAKRTVQAVGKECDVELYKTKCSDTRYDYCIGFIATVKEVL